MYSLDVKRLRVTCYARYGLLEPGESKGDSVTSSPFSIIWLSCFLTTACLLAGCSRGGPAPTFYVTGTVKLSDETPLSGGRVLFRPTSGKHSARGDVQEDGTFELTTFKSGDGAVAGPHKVMITPALPKDFMDEPAARAGYRSPIDQRYQGVSSTPLEFTVTDEGSNHFDIVVEPPTRSKRRR